MTLKDIIHLSRKELIRLHVIQKVLDRHITQTQASDSLKVSDRQIRRILERFKFEGEKGLAHKSRGRPSNNRTSDDIRAKAIELYKSRYADFGSTLASEKLKELHKIHVARQTLALWLKEAGLYIPRRKRSTHHLWRERKARFGQMLQMDGSVHDWLEGRGPKMTLMAYIDDATNTVFARFYDYEGTFPAMDSFKRYIKKYGIPQSVYFDRHTTYKSNAKLTVEDELAGRGPKSQFERALEELGVTPIHAYSPQAKGRIERLFGIFQDRLVKELRLAGAKTQEEANRFLEEYLPKYNRQFIRQARELENAHRKKMPETHELARILSIREPRSLLQNGTVHHKGKIYLVKKRFENRRPKTVFVEERLDGGLKVMDARQELEYAAVEEAPKTVYSYKRKRRNPMPGSLKSPWRHLTFSPKAQFKSHAASGHF